LPLYQFLKIHVPPNRSVARSAAVRATRPAHSFPLRPARGAASSMLYSPLDVSDRPYSG
jgi:hypothetical protein